MYGIAQKILNIIFKKNHIFMLQYNQERGLLMNKLVEYWINSSKNDYEAMNCMYKAGHFSWCLFLGHIVIEKLLKGIYAQNNPEDPYSIKTHNLLKLCEDCKINIDDDKKDMLTVINTFNISARYDDYKNEFYNKCTIDYTKKQIKNIEVIRKWLLELIKK